MFSIPMRKIFAIMITKMVAVEMVAVEVVAVEMVAVEMVAVEMVAVIAILKRRMIIVKMSCRCSIPNRPNHQKTARQDTQNTQSRSSQRNTNWLTT
jgi:hypothetical protein